ncbi:alpha-N-methyltransferase NTM1 [Cristinia sonorae]|uniref:Alpha N-terminal protein methyltransferase 1 n=1 Tax=Cristinia sonorae TaxID=1940300 RepID=A0A8K0UYP6_9AGAR|nr:alpha-N-methyltransferase NTM1 [Cristinia sonorae]
MTTPNSVPQPVVVDGIEYWNTQPANYDGVLGGFGTGSLPRIDALGSRQLLMYLLPELCTVKSAVQPLKPKPSNRRIRAVEVGAGVGRVTSDVLLHLVHDVVLVEPVDSFVQEAVKRGQESAEGRTSDPSLKVWKGIQDKNKSVMFYKGTLQAFDPAHPTNGTTPLGRVGYAPPEDDSESLFDIIWCQWCLGHLSDSDLVAFFKRCKAATRETDKSLIVVKENLCSDTDDGRPLTIFDESDSSLTRSDLAWKKAFTDAGLTLVYEQTQLGFPHGLFEVKMYALR